jgi:hypothetical protein
LVGHARSLVILLSLSGHGQTNSTSGALLFGPCSVPAGVVLRRVTVNAGTALVFDQVMAGGNLSIGSETCRLYSRINITFFGSAVDSTTLNFDSNLTATSKGLLAQGTVDVHGKLYAPTWTRLTHPASAGDSTIFLGQSTNWEVGQEVLITATAWFDCPAQWGSYCVPCFGWQTAQQPLVFNCHQ